MKFKPQLTILCGNLLVKENVFCINNLKYNNSKNIANLGVIIDFR